MSSLSYIFYKIKGTKLPAYDTVSFEGLNISTAELKRAIMTKKKMGLSTEVELMVEDEQSGKEYHDEDLIPKLKKVVVSRRVIGNVRALEPGQQEAPKLLVPPDPDVYEKKKAHDAADAAAKAKAAEASEAQNIFAAIAQSAKDLDPSKYMNMPKPRFPHHSHQQQYCFRCGKPGHLSAECLSGPGKSTKQDFSDIQINDIRLIKKATGIPNSELMPVDGPHYKGTVMTKSGQYAVPKIDARVHNEAQRRREPQGDGKPAVAAQREAVTVPPELKCGLCNDLLRDAVLTLCCNESFCDDCIRDALLSSDEHLCPKCQKPCAPASLVPNLNIRNFVRSFANENNYVPLRLQPKAAAPPPSADPTTPEAESERSLTPIQTKHEPQHQQTAPVHEARQFVRQSPPVPPAPSIEQQPTIHMPPHIQQQQAQQSQQPGITVVMMPQMSQFPGHFLMRPPFMNMNNLQFQPQAAMFPQAFNAPQAANQMAMMQAFIAQLRPIMAQHQFNEQQQQQFLETQIRQFQEQLNQQGQPPVIQPQPVQQQVVEPEPPPQIEVPDAGLSMPRVEVPAPAPQTQAFLPNLAQTHPSALVSGLAVRAAAAAAPFLNQARPHAQTFAEQLSLLVGGGSSSGGISTAGGNADTAAIERFLKRDVFPRRQFDHHQRPRRRSRSRSPRRRSRSRNRSRSRTRSPSRKNISEKQRRSRSRTPPRGGRSERDRGTHRGRDSPSLKGASNKSSSSQQGQSTAQKSAQIANALTALKAAGLTTPSSTLQPGALGKMSKRECEKMMDEWFEKVRAMHGENVEKLYRTAYQPYIDALLSGAEKASPTKEGELKEAGSASPSSSSHKREKSEAKEVEKKDEPVTSTVAETNKAAAEQVLLPENFVVVDEVTSSANKTASQAAETTIVAESKAEKHDKKKKHSVSTENGAENDEEKKAKKKAKKEKKHKKNRDGEESADGGEKEKKKKKKEKEKEKSPQNGAETEEEKTKRREEKRLRKEAKDARRRERAEKRERKLLKKQQKEAAKQPKSVVETSSVKEVASKEVKKEKFSSRDRNESVRSESRSRSRSRTRSRSRDKYSSSRSRSRSRDSRPDVTMIKLSSKKSASRDRSHSRSREKFISSRDRNENRSRSRSREKYASSREKERPLESYVVPASYPALRLAASSSPSRQRYGSGQQTGGASGGRRKY